MFNLNLSEALHLLKMEHDQQEAIVLVADLLQRGQITPEIRDQLLEWIEKHLGNGRLFIGIFPGGLVYADRHREVAGDYQRLAFLGYADLRLEIEPGVPPDLERQIVADAVALQARIGETFSISTCGQTVLLGESLKHGEGPRIVRLPAKTH